MWPRMHACSLQISRMASGDEPRLNTFGCPGMATGSTLYHRPSAPPVQRDAEAQARGAAREAGIQIRVHALSPFRPRTIFAPIWVIIAQMYTRR